MHPNLNLSEQIRSELTQNLNIIINSAAVSDLTVDFDVATRINVTGPLELLHLARQSPRMEVFVQVSTAFVNCDRTGYVEEALYSGGNNSIDWQADYDKIQSMTSIKLKKKGASFLRGFPDVYAYTKRMAEEMLNRTNTEGTAPPIPMVFIRPSIVVASESEPMPGWTDSKGMLNTLTISMGLGVMKDMPGNPDSSIDVIPVDYVARQLLVAVVYARTQAQQTQGREKLLIVHSATSGANPVTAIKFFQDIIKFQNMFPYEKRAGVAQLTMHENVASYQRAFRYRSQLPTQALYYITRVFSTRKYRGNVNELKDGIEQVRQANLTFQFYMYNQWVFDNANTQKLEDFLQ